MLSGVQKDTKRIDPRVQKQMGSRRRYIIFEYWG